MDSIFQDIRFAFRSLVRKPGFAAVAVFTLALGIGANTAILSAVNGFLIRPMPVEKPGELALVNWGNAKDTEVWGDFSHANYLDLRERNRSFSGLIAYNLASAALGSVDRSDSSPAPEVVTGEMVSANFFDVLGVKPALGRGFLPEEDVNQNTHPVVVISHAVWRQRFNADPAIVGKSIALNGSPFTVVGVAPESFKGLKYGIRFSFWAPLMMRSRFGGGTDWQNNRSWTMVHLLGRLKPGVTTAQAETDLNAVNRSLAIVYPKDNEGKKVQVLAETDGRFQTATRTLKVGAALALGISALVLLVACANVANLMLARATGQAKDIGIRIAIGAGRFRIMRQLLIESVVLALLGGLFGALLAYWGTDLIQASFPPSGKIYIDLDVHPDAETLKWMFGVSLLTSVIFGLAPAFWASRPDLVAVIRSDAAGRTRGEARRILNPRGLLVVAQVAMSIGVLICAGLFLRSLIKVAGADAGFRTETLVTMSVSPGLVGYDDARGTQFYSEMLRRVGSQPGVKSVSLAEYLPLSGTSDGVSVVRDGEPDPPPDRNVRIRCNFIAPKYFETLQTRLVAGREFSDRDTTGAPGVVIVNQAFARKIFGSESEAIGRRIRFTGSSDRSMEIVGIARDGVYDTLYEDPNPFVFLPTLQRYRGEMTLLISANVAADMTAVATGAQREIGNIDARVPAFGIRMGGENLAYAFWGPRLAAGMATAFGLLALLLATMGLYSVIAYAVSRRTQEIGIRMALGASIPAIVRMILVHGMALAGIGIILGLAGAFAVTRLMAGLLFGVTATDPLTFILVPTALVAVIGGACWIPARRAALTDPMEALRNQS